MSAVEEAVTALIAGGMEPGAAAVLMARAAVEASTPKRSKEAARAARYREKKRLESVTKSRRVTTDGTPHERDEIVTNRDAVTCTYLSKKVDSTQRHSSRKRCSLPADFLLSDKMRLFALGKGLDPPRIIDQFERFCDHHRSKGSLFVDWEAAWRTWVGRTSEFSPRNGSAKRGGLEGIV